MKKLLKALLLGCITIGMAVGCNDNKSSTIPSSSDQSSSSSSLVSSSELSSSSFEPVGPKATSIAIDTTNVKKTYIEGEALDTTGLVVTATFDDGTTKVVEDYETSPAKGSTLRRGNMNVIVSYQGCYQQYYVFAEKAPKTAWTEAEKELISAHTYNEIIPFIGYEECTIEWKSDVKALYIVGGKYEDTKYQAYKEALAAASWEFTSEGEGLCTYEKNVTANDGLRHLGVIFGERDQDNKFVVAVTEPYEYTFPTEYATKEALDDFGSNVPVPVLPADYYAYNVEGRDIYCYLNSDKDDAGYSAILIENGWSIRAQKDAKGYYVAVSQDGLYQISYLYVNNKMLVINLEQLDFWNFTLIEDFFIKYDSYAFAIPWFEKAGARYLFVEYSANANYYKLKEYYNIQCLMAVFGATADDLPAYAQKAKDEGWDVFESGGRYIAHMSEQVKEKTEATVFTFYYDASYNAVIVLISLTSIHQNNSEFPSEKIALLLDENITDTVPAYEGATQGITMNAEWRWVFVIVEKGTNEEALEEYKKTLLENDYTAIGVDIYGDARYLSPNGQIVITVFTEGEHEFIITFKEAPLFEFPGDKLAETYNKGDTVPALEGGYEYHYQLLGRLTSIGVVYKDNAEATSKCEAYVALLLANDYEEGEKDGDGDMHYLSKNMQIDVCPIVNENVVYIGIKDAVPPGWPTAKIKAFLGDEITDTVPEYTKGESYLSLIFGTTYEVCVRCKEGKDADEKMDEYKEILLEAKYTFVEYNEDMDEYIYLSENEQIQITLCSYGDEFTVDIEAYEAD